MIWRRNLWGVEFRSGRTVDAPLLLGTAWNKPRPGEYPGEPTRALLFVSRATARAWCKAKLAQYAGRTDSCALWRFQAIRVRETVIPLSEILQERGTSGGRR